MQGYQDAEDLCYSTLMLKVQQREQCLERRVFHLFQ